CFRSFRRTTDGDRSIRVARRRTTKARSAAKVLQIQEAFVFSRLPIHCLGSLVARLKPSMNCDHIDQSTNSGKPRRHGVTKLSIFPTNTDGGSIRALDAEPRRPEAPRRS